MGKIIKPYYNLIVNKNEINFDRILLQVEMTDNHKFQDILCDTLQSDRMDTCLVSEYKNDLYTITKSKIKVWAPMKATIVSCVAKLIYPNWDTRYHQVQIGGKYSLRTIDRKYVASFLFKKGLYPTATEYALTRSFEKAEPFTKNYTGKITAHYFLRYYD